MRRPVLLKTIRNEGGVALSRSEEAQQLLNEAGPLADRERNAAIAQAAQIWTQTNDRLREEIRREADRLHPAYDPWNSPRWAGYRPQADTQVESGARLGITHAPGTELQLWLERLRLSPDESAALARFTGARVAESPLVAPFSAEESFTFIRTTTEQGFRTAIAAGQSVVWRLAGAVSPALLKFSLFDTMYIGSEFRSILALPASMRGNSVASTDDTVRALFAELQRHATEMNVSVLTNAHRDLWSYNAAHPALARAFRYVFGIGFPGEFSPQTINALQMLISGAAQAGVGGLIVGAPGVPLPHGVAWPSGRILQVSEQPQSSTGWVASFAGAPNLSIEVTLDAPPPTSFCEQIAQIVTDETTAHSTRTLVRPKRTTAPWTGNATDQLTATIGQYADQKPITLAIDGDKHVHMLMGGQIGSGKSVLLHNLITDLTWTYSPEELNLYLIDLKAGVEFQVYQDLPHARFIVNKANVGWGVAILEGIQEMIDRRAQRFKDEQSGISDYEAYRNHRPQEKLPRIVLVIDEFQVLLLDSELKAQAAAILVDLAKRSRSHGIHLVLATQTWTSNLPGLDEILAQTNTRIALRFNSPSDTAHVLGSGGRAIPPLVNQGEVAVTLDPLLPDSLKTGRVFALERFDAKQLAENLNTLAQNQHLPPKLNLRVSGEEPPQWPAYAPELLKHRDASDPLPLLLGRPLKLAPDLTATLSRDDAQSMLIAGQQTAVSARIVTSICRSAIEQKIEVRLFSWGALQPPDPWSELMALDQRAHSTPGWSWTRDADLADLRFGRLIEEMDARRAGQPPTPPPPVLIVIPAFEQWRAAFESPEYGEDALTSQHLLKLATNGPAVGMHLVLHCRSTAAFSGMFGYGNGNLLSHFGHRVVGSCSREESLELLDTNAASQLSDKTALYRVVSSRQTAPQLFEPYGA